ncbi:hypothetical protein [Chitinophaga sp. sic0106]|uniref:BPSS1187 family protein n=1 Tax=Chitinophaga sp. sic0106 TaxID=2854785 RepID=UPI001C43EDA3|nr:hypothetical protein [Chitinophaga sp. sic0106]MBV7533125.1 hypothetical protein [Chitinophaga sp. sic0106]
MKAYNPLTYIIALLFGSTAVTAQIRHQEISPATTTPSQVMVHTPHLVYEPAAKNKKQQLFIMIPGTNGKAADFRRFDSSFAAMGYFVITPDYMNKVVTTVCSVSEDSTCFNNFREEIMFGTPVSDKVQVDSANSLVQRITTLLNFLAKQQPKQWAQFVSNGKPRWDRIIVGGHSQGAGHAAYFGKRFPMAGVLLFSGPQDYLQQFRQPAGWQLQPGKTPVSRIYALLHLQDPFNYNYQIQDVAAVNQQQVTDTTMVQPNTPVSSRHQIFVTDIDKKDKHGSTLGTEFVEVWKVMIHGAGRK